MFSKNILISNYTIIRPGGCELSHKDGQTDRGTDRRTDRETARYIEANNRLLQFYESIYKLLLLLVVSTIIKLKENVMRDLRCS